MIRMVVTDLYGKNMQITDLAEAIRQAELYKGFQHVDTRYRNLDKELRAYWKDMYEKLLRLRAALQANENHSTL